MFSNSEYHELEQEHDALKLKHQALVALAEAWLEGRSDATLADWQKLQDQRDAANRSAERWRKLAFEEKTRADKWTEAHGALVIEAGMRHEKDVERIAQLEADLRFAQGELRRLLTGDTETNGTSDRRDEEASGAGRREGWRDDGSGGERQRGVARDGVRLDGEEEETAEDGQREEGVAVQPSSEEAGQAAPPDEEEGVDIPAR